MAHSTLLDLCIRQLMVPFPSPRHLKKLDELPESTSERLELWRRDQPSRKWLPTWSSETRRWTRTIEGNPSNLAVYGATVRDDWRWLSRLALHRKEPLVWRTFLASLDALLATDPDHPLRGQFQTRHWTLHQSSRKTLALRMLALAPAQAPCEQVQRAVDAANAVCATSSTKLVPAKKVRMKTL